MKEKLEHATNLMRHANPSGDLSPLVERAIDLLIDELEKRRLGKATRPSSNASGEQPRRGYVARAVRRQVFERDGTQCTFGREHIEKRKKDPLRRGSESNTALRALTAMGFKEPQARRALASIEERWAGLAPPLETVLRETLAILT